MPANFGSMALNELVTEIRQGIAGKFRSIEAQGARLEQALGRFEAAAETFARAAAVFEAAAGRLNPEAVTPAAAKSGPRWFERIIGRA